ncbi:hypothetical protein LAZ67_1002732 [Cordylochernes scorpioides]|uniref:Uncharacterized protein n=1 Tax=Cordylochernes scorpioides TaxID=51811 RepID=A0ABY6JWM8_9ARAC|nr:hypothetical protein LAZ67_1002732 [Cordylochernes scorpioides]
MSAGDVSSSFLSPLNDIRVSSLGGAIVATCDVAIVTTVGTDLLQTLQGLTELGLQGTGGHLVVFTVLYILLPVQKLIRNFVLARIGHNRDQLLNLFF